jgi:hypothetical protein
MNTVESFCNIMAHIYSFCDTKTQREFVCVSKKLKEAGELASFKNDVEKRIALLHKCLQTPNTLDLLYCDSNDEITRRVSCYSQELSKTLTNEQMKYIVSILLPQKPLEVHEVVTSLIALINSQQFQSVHTLIEAFLRDNKTSQVLAHVLLQISEENALHLLNVPLLELSQENYQNSTAFRIIQEGNPVAYNYFNPFLSSKNIKIVHNAFNLLSIAIVKINLMNVDTDREKLRKSVYNILNSLDNRQSALALCNLLLNITTNPQNNSDAFLNADDRSLQMTDWAEYGVKKSTNSNYDLYKSLFNNPFKSTERSSDTTTKKALERARKQQPIEFPLESKSTEISHDATLRQTLEEQMKKQSVELENLSSRSELTQRSEEALSIAVSLLDVHPQEAFNYLIQNSDSFYGYEDVQMVYEFLKNALQKISDKDQKKIALSQLFEWSKNDRYEMFNVKWLIELRQMIDKEAIKDAQKAHINEKQNHSTVLNIKDAQNANINEKQNHSIVLNNIEKTSEAIELAKSIQVVDPREAFDYMLQNAGSNYWISVYSVLLSSAQIMTDREQKLKAYHQLIKWLEKGLPQDMNEIWIQDVKNLIDTDRQGLKEGNSYRSSSSYNDSNHPSSCLASATTTTTITTTTSTTATTTVISSSISTAAPSKGNTYLSSRFQKSVLQTLIEQMAYVNHNATEYVDQLYGIMIEEGLFYDGICLIDRLITDPIKKNVILALLVEHMMNKGKENPQQFQSIFMRISDPAVIQDLCIRFNLMK